MRPDAKFVCLFVCSFCRLAAGICVDTTSKTMRCSICGVLEGFYVPSVELIEKGKEN